MQGWIKTYRSICEHWLWQDKPFSKGQAFIDLMLLANHADNKMLDDSSLTLVKRGELLTSIRILCERWGWSNTKVKKFLNVLEEDKMIVSKSDRRKTVITICNYDEFQNADKLKNITENSEKHFQNITETLTKHNTNDNNASQEHHRDDSSYTYYIKNVKNDNNDKNVVEVAELSYSNRENLFSQFPDMDWDAYDEEDFKVKKANFYVGQGVVFLSTVQQDFLIEKLGTDTTEYYVKKLADFIVSKNANVKNHFATILKWSREDEGA